MATTGLPCSVLGYKEYSGQCYYPDNDNHFCIKTCRDRSHDTLHLPKNDTCPPTFLSCLVDDEQSCLSPYLHCDMHPQCDDGKDEIGCKHVYKMERLAKTLFVIRFLCYPYNFLLNIKMFPALVNDTYIFHITDI